MRRTSVTPIAVAFVSEPAAFADLDGVSAEPLALRCRSSAMVRVYQILHRQRRSEEREGAKEYGVFPEARSLGSDLMINILFGSYTYAHRPIRIGE